MKYLVYGYYGYNNLGDELLLNSIVNSINTKDDSAYFTVLNKSSDSLKDYQNVKYSNIRDILHSSTNKIVKFIKFFKEFKTNIDNNDVFIIGGGTLFMDDGRVSFLMAYLSYFVSYARKKNKKIILIGIGIDILVNPFSLVWIKKILNNSTRVYCRDALSFQIAKKISLENNILLTQDLVFSNEEISHSCNHIRNSDSKTIGISLIDYILKFNGSFISEINNILSFYIQNGFNIKLLAFQVYTDKADNIFYKKLMTHENIQIINLNIDNYKEHFMSLDYVLSMRFHGILLGILFGKKVIGIVHESKNYQLCLDSKIEYIFLNDFCVDNIKDKSFNNIDKDILNKLTTASNLNFDFLKEETI